MRRGWAITNLHGGDRGAYIREYDIHASVVSRALDLINLPEQILACAEDRETRPTLFAEKLAPRLHEKSERRTIFARAKALNGERLPSARLQASLLTGERSAPPPDRRNIAFGTGRNPFKASVIFGHDGSAVFKVPPQTALSDEQCQELASFLEQQVEELILSGDHG